MLEKGSGRATARHDRDESSATTHNEATVIDYYESQPQMDYAERQADTAVCAALGCCQSDNLRRVTDDNGRTRTLCPPHRKDFLGVSS